MSIIFLDNAAKVAGGISAAPISIVISSRPQLAMKGSGTIRVRKAVKNPEQDTRVFTRLLRPIAHRRRFTKRT
jgi:hypothetical protein